MVSTGLWGVLLKDVVLLYEYGEYERVIEEGETLLAEGNLTPEEKKALHVYLAFSYVALEQKDLAKEHFGKILEVDPDFTLNPEFVSPKIIAVFEEVKRELQLERVPREGGKPSKAKAVLYEIVLPGWGHSYIGQKKKAKMVQYAYLASLGIFMSSVVGCELAHNSYLQAEAEEDISRAYSVYNAWYKARYITFFITVEIWTYAVLDVLFSE